MATYDPVVFAERSLNEFDRLMAEHRAAMDCRLCEDAMQSAINVFAWLERAKEIVTQAEDECLTPHDAELHAAIEAMCRELLQLSGELRSLVAKIESDGYVPNNLEEFEVRRAFAAEWLRCQEDIRNATLPHAQLSQYAKQT